MEIAEQIQKPEQFTSETPKNEKPHDHQFNQKYSQQFVVVILVIFIIAIVAAGAFYVGLQSAKPTNKITPPLVPNSISTSTPKPISPDIVGMKTITITHDTSLGYPDYQISIPNDWTHQEHSSNFQQTETFAAPDKSEIEVFIDDKTSENLEAYLQKSDKENQTAWEGLPSKKVVSQKDLEIDSHKAIQRVETLEAAGFSTTFTYIQDNHVLSIHYIPSSTNAVSEASKMYDQILSTFKFAN